MERLAKEAVAARERQQGHQRARFRDHYRDNWRLHHELEAAALASTLPPDAPEPISDEIRAQRQLETQREVADRELATTDQAKRASAWTAERSRILRERARVKREAEEQGRGEVFFAAPPPSATPPDWWMKEDGVVITRSAPPQERPQERPRELRGERTLRLPGWDALSGRSANQEKLEHPEAQIERKLKEARRND